MAPQIIQTPTGRIIAVANYPSIGHSVESAIDPITGRIFLAGSVKVTEFSDTYVCHRDGTRDTNYSTRPLLAVERIPQTPPTSWPITRTFIKCESNKILHLFSYEGQCRTNIEVCEINPNNYNTTTITWNNQPSLGSVIFTYTPSNVNVWDEIPTGSIGAICLKYVNEADTLSDYRYWRSLQYTDDPTKHPYISDP